ncbi:MAG: hypothetical protein ACD_3C00111G0002 [uncultured bacterium (gcode 4)]|uniref:PKD domain-containing protein n=1 Tax=uncultured bacterium (gcode 4) TaxID=1234023 RepID=K2GX86_9BACT|nr:MAG: hypothetical protein ACD_3C00111G0002 [uncultured bacterium (gcode 4)]
MKTNLIKVLALCFMFLAAFSIVSAATFTTWEPEQPYCNNPADCTIDKWTDVVANNVNDIQKNKKFSVYVQDIAAYLVIFIWIIGVLYIIYSGFVILTSSGDDWKVKKAKVSIMYVLIWIILVFLAYPIIKWAVWLVNSSGTSFEMPTFIERTYAYTTNDANTFDESKKKVEILASDLERDYKVNGKISTSNLLQLQTLVNESITTFPDDDNFVTNNSIARNLLIAIDVVKKSPDSDTKITELAKNLKDFLTRIKIPRISAKITATPQSWSAPLSVTLRASDVVDPSWVIVPQWNYIWWIKQASGRKVLWTWPSINYTFKEEKNYIVNLDIVSASRNTKWKIDVLPFSWTIKIDVLPSVGNIFFYINWINVSDMDRFKITPNIWKAWLIMDASASQPASWSKFSKTSWNFWNWNSFSYDLYPRIEKQYYVNEWNYSIVLKLVTNEWKEISKNLYLEVRDPVASIKSERNTWFVGEDFKFSVNTTFMEWTLNYEWKIIELGWNQPILTSSKENISYKFKKTGKYAVKLKSTSPSGKEDTDTVVITIESRDPIAVFDVTNSNSETPNVFKLDASQSFDPDTFDNSKLTFSWQVDGQKVDLESPSRNWAIWKYTFNSEWNHKIVLDISNQEGKTATVKKEVSVNSLLSVKMNFSPKIVKNGTPISIIADSKETTAFEWSFWDWETDTTNAGRINHVYKKSWTYNLGLTVRWKRAWDSNTITRKVYVSDWVSPFALITMKSNNDEYFLTPDACDWNDAYILDRANMITFSANDSTNIDWSTSGLSYSWKYMNRTSSQPQFSYKFDELGCFPVTLTVKSQKNWKINTVRNFVKIENLPPKISGLSVTTLDMNSDPVIVKVAANNPTDADWAIVSYLWYYYTDSDPEPQDYRVTKQSSTTFVLPRVTGKYYFVLVAEDSNWAKYDTDKETDNKYSIQLSTDNVNTPIIKLTADKTSIATWDEINFEATVSDILGKDISNKVEYKWDFDGDWFYDDTTTSWKVSHKFSTPWNISLKVKVTHKGISNTKYQLISVKNTLKPNFEYYSIGKKLVLLNTTEWVYNTATWTLWNDVSSTNLDSFVYDFKDEDFPEKVSLKVSDWQSSKTVELSVRKDVVNLSKVSRSTDKLIAFTYPSSDNGTIHMTKAGNKLFIYLGESKWWASQYCIDTDAKIDSDLNGTTDDDCDNKWTDSYTSWTPFVIKDFDNSIKERSMKLSISNWSKIIESKEIKVILDYIESKSTKDFWDNKDISDSDRKWIEELKTLIKKAPERERLQMMQYLSSLQENWFDDREKTKTVIDFESYINSSGLDQKLKDEFYNLLEWFLVTQNQAKDEVSLAAKVLKSLIPKTNPNYEQIVKNIDEILSHPTNTKLNKDLGTFILDSIKNDENIPNKDKVIIKSQLLVIIYGSQKNIPADLTAENGEAESDWWWIMWFISWFVKVVLYIILFLLFWVLLLFVYFKITNKNENLSFQDFIIEMLLQKNATPKPQAPKQDIPPPPPSQPKQDILSSIPEPTITPEQPTIAEPPVATVPPIDEYNPQKAPSKPTAEPDAWLPDWLKWMSASEKQESVPPSVTEKEMAPAEEVTAKEAPSLAQESDLPDWLKGMDSKELQNEIEEELSWTASQEIYQDEISKTPEEPASEAQSELPDWLKWIPEAPAPEQPKTEENKTEEIIPAEEAKKPESDELPDWLKSAPPEPETDKDSGTSEEQSVSASEDTEKPEENIPDWLKWSSPAPDEDIQDNEEEENPFIESTSLDLSEPAEQKPEKKPHPKKEKKPDTTPADEADFSTKQVKPFPKKPTSKQNKENVSQNDEKQDDLPDWLK